MSEHSKVTAEVIRAAMALAQRDVDLGLISIDEIESIPRTRFAPIERKKIAEALSAQGISNRQIAEVTGVSPQTIGRDLSVPDGTESIPFGTHDAPQAPQNSGARTAPVDDEDKPFVDTPDDREMKKRRAAFLKSAGAALGYAQAYDGPIDSHVIKVASAVAAQWKQFVRQLKEQRSNGQAQI